MVRCAPRTAYSPGAVLMVRSRVSRTSKQLKLLLPPGGFGAASVRAQARLEHRSLSSLMGAAVRRYVAGLGKERPAARVPRFARGAATEKADEAALEFELTLDDEQWATLSDEAERQGVTVEALAAHAALLYVADRSPRGAQGADVSPLPPLPPRTD